MQEGVVAAKNTSASSQSGAVLAEDTYLNVMSPISNEPRGINGSKSVNTTSIPDTCGQK